jgi:hypothetical protein
MGVEQTKENKRLPRLGPDEAVKRLNELIRCGTDNLID